MAGAEQIVATTLRFTDDGTIPNNPDLPVVILPAAVGPDETAEDIQARVRRNGWGGAWLYGVFPYHHYHAEAHEALIVVSGEARLLLGGDSGQEITVHRGDVLVLPAGTGHKCQQSSSDFLVCGCYPSGQESADLQRSTSDRTGVLAKIRAVPLPETDPLFGALGPLIGLWAPGASGARPSPAQK